MGLTEHARRNRDHWGKRAADFRDHGRRAWASDEPSWGIFGVPERELGALGDTSLLAGADVVELGCGTAYWSAWLARLGARPVGVDVTPEQLATARELQREHGLEFPLVEASAEDVPLPDASFDLAFSEYGASIWCAPGLWLAEAARLLRPGGRLVFLTGSVLTMLCTPPDEGPVDEHLHRPQLDMERFEWEDGSVEFHLPHGRMIDLLARLGFAVEALVEVHAPAERPPTYAWDELASHGWARRWPVEEIWRARLA